MTGYLPFTNNGKTPKNLNKRNSNNYQNNNYIVKRGSYKHFV